MCCISIGANFETHQPNNPYLFPTVCVLWLLKMTYTKTIHSWLEPGNIGIFRRHNDRYKQTTAAEVNDTDSKQAVILEVWYSSEVRLSVENYSWKSQLWVGIMDQRDTFYSCSDSASHPVAKGYLLHLDEMRWAVTKRQYQTTRNKNGLNIFTHRYKTCWWWYPTWTW